VFAFRGDLAEDDWRKEIVDYLEDPSRKVSRKLRYKAIKFVLLDGSLFYKSLDGVLLRCLGPEEANKMMSVGHTPRVLMHGRGKSRRRTPTRIPLYSY
jgi:hypothetical protein